MTDTAKQKRWTEFLLRQLPEEEQEDLEREFFENDGRAAELLAAEDLLLEEYAAGTLDPETKRRFEEILQRNVSQRRELEVVNHLKAQPVPDQAVPVSRRRIPAFAVAAVLAMLAMSAGILLYQNGLLREEIRNLEQSRVVAPAVRVPVPSPIPYENPPGPTPIQGDVPTILLVAGLRETGALVPVLQVPAAASLFVLQADVPLPGATECRVRVETVGGDVLYDAGPLRVESHAGKGRVHAPIPSGVAPPGDYILIVQRREGNGFRIAGEYYFRIESGKK